MKTALISGATRGIGYAIAMQLYTDGFNLSLGIRDLEKVQSIFSKLDPTHLHFKYLINDTLVKYYEQRSFTVLASKNSLNRKVVS